MCMSSTVSREGTALMVCSIARTNLQGVTSQRC